MPSAYADATIVGQRSGVSYADLGLANQGALDTHIVALNERASAAIEAYCRRDFIQHTSVTEKYDGTDDRFLDLRGWPVISITSVTEDGSALVAGTDYRQKPSQVGAEDVGILEKADGDTWAYDWESIVIVYTWGYATPPLEVRRVAEDLVIRMLQAAKASREATGASSVSMDGFSVTYDRAVLNAAMLTPDDMASLAKWRNTRLG